MSALLLRAFSLDGGDGAVCQPAGSNRRRCGHQDVEPRTRGLMDERRAFYVNQQRKRRGIQTWAKTSAPLGVCSDTIESAHKSVHGLRIYSWTKTIRKWSDFVFFFLLIVPRHSLKKKKAWLKILAPLEKLSEKKTCVVVVACDVEGKKQNQTDLAPFCLNQSV